MNEHMKGALAAALVASCIAGCVSETPVAGNAAAANCVRPEAPQVKTTAFLGETKIEDEQFKLVYTKQDANLDCKDPDVDIRDLQAFAITVYRQQLKNKLQSGAKLTAGEVELLKFVCYVQHVTLSCFTAYAYGNLTGLAHPLSQEFNDGPKASKETATRDFFHRAVENFGKNGNILAKLIDRWVQEARSPDATGIFEQIVSPEYGKKSSTQEIKISAEEFFLLAIPWVGYGFYVSECRRQDACNKPKDGNFVPDEYVQMFKEIDNRNMNNKQKALLWGRVAESLRFYSQDLGELHRDLGMGITAATDKKTKRAVEDLRIKYASWCEDDFYKFREVYYAYPFIRACNELNDRIQDARHTLWWNNIKAMESATMMFCEQTSVKDNEMVKNLNSRYAAKVYGDTLQELKDRAGDEEYKEIQDKCRLWSLDDPEFKLGDEVFGQRVVKRWKDGKVVADVKSRDQDAEDQDKAK